MNRLYLAHLSSPVRALVGATALLVVLLALSGGAAMPSSLASFGSAQIEPRWQLDPRRDYLLIMFPQGFFFWATIFIAMATVLEALLLAGVAAALLRWRGRVEGIGKAPGTSRSQGR